MPATHLSHLLYNELARVTFPSRIRKLAQETSGRGIAGKPDDEKHPRLVTSPSKEPSPGASSCIRHVVDSQKKGKQLAASLGHHKEEPGEFKVTTQWDNSGSDFHYSPVFSEHDQPQQDWGPKPSADVTGKFFPGWWGSSFRS
ncbi:UNVERIFIED_CONTAM: hypothetical protein Sangu_0672800 [Sesamum angustifolium]|uniref:Uncharacterized protein n=1 Tax=Sesamum angustifolium TaxID=2727405 RepID=A0AAW2QD18_9LAMI